MPIIVAAQCKAWVCGPSLAGIARSNPAGGMYVWVLWMLCGVVGRDSGVVNPFSE